MWAGDPPFHISYPREFELVRGPRPDPRREPRFGELAAVRRGGVRVSRFGDFYPGGLFTVTEGPEEDVRAAAETLRGIARLRRSSKRRNSSGG